MNNSSSFRVLWSQVDANQHLRHSAYADFAAQARVEALVSVGLTSETFQKHNIGPILFREELIYRREVAPNDSVTVTTELAFCKEDASRWTIKHEMFRGDGIKAAEINVDGAWMDLHKRKLTRLSDDMREKFLNLRQSESQE